MRTWTPLYIVQNVVGMFEKKKSLAKKLFWESYAPTDKNQEQRKGNNSLQDILTSELSPSEMHCVAEQGDTILNSTYTPAKRVVELTSACEKWLKKREIFSNRKERKQSVIVTNARRGGDRKAESGRRPSQMKAEQKRRETLPAWMTPYITTHAHAHHIHACIHTCIEWPYMNMDVPNVPKVKRSSEESTGSVESLGT